MRFHNTAITLFIVMPGMLISLGAQTIAQSEPNTWQPVSPQSSPLPLSPAASLSQTATSISTSPLVSSFGFNAAPDSFTTSAPSDKASHSTYRPAEVSVVPCRYMCRHRKELLPLLIGGAVFVEAADVYDTRETQIGLRHGVAVEGNTWLIGSHPSFRAGLARDQIMIGVSLIAPTLGWVKRWPLLFGGSLNEPYIVGIKHIRAGNAWRKLLGD